MRARGRKTRFADKTAPSSEASPSPHVSPLAGMRDTLGNRGFGQFLQTKLTAGPANDPLEREADQVAERVVSARQPAVQTPDVSASVATRVESRGGGEPLAPPVRAYFEPRLGQDLG